jgi:hypothetical protein
VLKRTAAAAEQFQIIPTMPSGALSPVFLSWHIYDCHAFLVRSDYNHGIGGGQVMLLELPDDMPLMPAVTTAMPGPYRFA